MISQHNYEKAQPVLEYEVKKRGWNINLYRRDWDTFSGWKKRGKSIIKGSKGFTVEIIFPYIANKTIKKTKILYKKRAWIKQYSKKCKILNCSF